MKSLSLFLSVVSISSLCLVSIDSAHAAPRAKSKVRSSAAKNVSRHSTVEKSSAARASNPAPSPSCKSLLLMEPVSGDVILSENADTPLPPASMVKTMTALVVMERVREGAVKLSDVVTVSADSSKTGGSQVFLAQGEQFTLDQLMNALLVQSANDSALAIAEYVGGSREGFVEMMNATAKRIGMNSSSFHSPHGLPPDAGEEPDLVSANDFGLLAREIVTKYPEILDYTKKTTETFRDGKFVMNNHNHLLGSFPGCDGIKTGYYGAAGFNITATAVRNNVRMVAVAMGCGQRKVRDAEVSKLLSRGFVEFRPAKLIEKGSVVEVKASVTGGSEAEVSLVSAGDAQAVVRGGKVGEVERKIDGCGALPAPVTKDTPCGTLRFYQNGRELAAVPLVTAADVAKGGVTQRIRAMIGM